MYNNNATSEIVTYEKIAGLRKNRYETDPETEISMFLTSRTHIIVHGKRV